MSVFSEVELGEPVEMFYLKKAYLEDKFENKVFLSVGAYRTDEGKPWVLPVVKSLEKILSHDESLNKEYLPTLGLETFSTSATTMLLGLDSPAIIQKRYCGIQSISGTGSLRIGAEFLVKMGKKIFYVSNPTWENHKRLFLQAGFEECREYRYWNPTTRRIDFEGLIDDLDKAPQDAVVILHVCAHNPTGVDPTPEQWSKIANIIHKRRLFPFFDCAFQGFVTGNVISDAYSIRLFVSLGFELFCAQSFSKNFGLYNERIGNLTIVVNNPDLIPAIKSQITYIVNGMYLNPPGLCARIVTYVLNNSTMYNQWQDNVRTMSSRLLLMRKQLKEILDHLETPGNWDHLVEHSGFFSYTGLTPVQVEYMVNKYHIYMLASGRMSIAGLNSSNVYYVAKAIYDTVSLFP
ncbi:unnamed protein product [Psylliodes chrysocephalus]|uniref:Aspartate aminotransferase n=1 Tax=Psylliodes chrysocephalus TaxID=3402493 RepID=A0A9P0GM07_9CUCU|nr:unnamed protein product [Psylliodes chrysocephala]